MNLKVASMVGHSKTNNSRELGCEVRKMNDKEKKRFETIGVEKTRIKNETIENINRKRLIF